MHLEATEGVDIDNWDKYNSSCLQCFKTKFELHTQHCIEYKNSGFDNNKEFYSKHKNGGELLVQNVSTARFEVDKDWFYTDVNNKDWKDKDFFNKSLMKLYQYEVKKKTTTTANSQCKSLKSTKKDIREAEKINRAWELDADYLFDNNNNFWDPTFMHRCQLN
eukprot:15366180-Ditylum_brightwellii.AAC.1